MHPGSCLLVSKAGLVVTRIRRGSDDHSCFLVEDSIMVLFMSILPAVRWRGRISHCQGPRAGQCAVEQLIALFQTFQIVIFK